METIAIGKEIYLGFFKFIGFFILLNFIFEIIARYFLKFSMKYTKAILILFKAVFYGFLLFFTLFFNFEIKRLSLQFPDSISFTKMIMVPITAFEMFSNIMDLFDLDNYYITK